MKRFELGTIFRRRWGHGRGAFGHLCNIETRGGPGMWLPVRGTVQSLPVRRCDVRNARLSLADRIGIMQSDGHEMATVDLQDLHNAPMVPVFVSRIRTRRGRR